MASCYCTEIKQWGVKIKRLEEAIEEVEYLASSYMNISRDLDDLVSYAKEAYETDNMDSFSSTVVNLKYDMRDAMDSCKSAISKAIDKLADELTEMEKEDEEYHEVEEWKRSISANQSDS